MTRGDATVALACAGILALVAYGVVMIARGGLL